QNEKGFPTGERLPPLTWSHVLQCEVLIRKAASVDGLSPGAIVVGEVARLQPAGGCHCGAGGRAPGAPRAHPARSPSGAGVKKKKKSKDIRSNKTTRKASKNKA
uniref:Uncharacterized protein n=1 Tax=Lynx canadensis TaxID=61383 RepID=A0A667IXF5_LYNCA